jgi:uncharacterized protein (DUF427 family)
MKATWNGQVIAEANKDELIYIEGNWYFPPSRVHMDYFQPSSEHSTCFWKGEASYYTVEVNGSKNEGAAWYYPAPMPGAIDRVKKDFSNYVAFWRGVEVAE